MYKVQKLFSVILPLIICAACFSGCVKNKAEQAFKNLRSGGLLRVGIIPGIPGFCFQSPDGEYDGLEPALARLVTAEIIGPHARVDFVEINAQTRNIMLDSGEIDLVIGNFTITGERKERFHFSAPYSSGAVGFMVKKNSGIKTLSDLEYKTVGIIQGSTTAASITDAVPDLNIHYVRLLNFPEAKAALDDGTIDVFSVDIPMLRGFLDDTVEILNEEINIQYYGIACRLSQTELAKAVNACVDKLLKDGTIKDLTVKYDLPYFDTLSISPNSPES